MAAEEQNQATGPQQAGVSGWIVVALLIVIAALLYKYAVPIQSDLHDPNAAPRSITARGDQSEIEKSQNEIFQQAAPSVVNITAATLGRLPNTAGTEIPQETGTATIRSADGHTDTT